MNDRYRLRTIFFSIVAATTFLSGTHAAESPAPKGWSEVPSILKRIVPPKFPDREFAIAKFGAVGDGTSDCTVAFRDAIDACSKAGGGRVTVPPGRYLTGAIHLKSHVNLHVSKGATILFSTNPVHFLPVVFSRDRAEMMNYSPLIYAFEQENVAVTGEGTLDGQASKGVWPAWVKKAGADAEKLAAMGDRELPVSRRVLGQGYHIRPNFVEPVRCRNVLIEGVTVVDSPMWVLHPVYCTNVTIRGVTVISHGKNNDGCDPDSCTDVLIEDCTFDTGDDCIAVKAGRDHDGRRVNIPCENVVIRGCRFRDGHGGVTLGSETAGGLRNVFAENCHFDSTNLDIALRFKSNPERGGFIKNVHIRNSEIKTARYGIHMTLRYFGREVKDAKFIPEMRDIDIRDCKFDRLLDQAVFIEGYSPKSQISDVTVTNCEFPAGLKENTVTNAVRIQLTGNRITQGK